MTCSRCCGLMVKDNLMDFEGTSGHTWMSAMRCMNCGHMQDPIMEQNRRRAQAKRPTALLVAAGGETDYDDDLHLGLESIVAKAA